MKYIHPSVVTSMSPEFYVTHMNINNDDNMKEVQAQNFPHLLFYVQ